MEGIIHAPCAKPALRPESRDALLTAIANGLLCLFERTAWPIVAPEPGARPPREAVRVDVDARMRGMWR